MLKGTSPEHYSEQLKQLLPKGVAWTPELNSVMYKVLEGLGVELSRVDFRAVDLIGDSIPSIETLFDELLGEWENVVGLPDECFNFTGQTDEQRRRRVIEKLNGGWGQSADYFIGIIKSVTGEEAIITLYVNFRAGKSRVGDALTNDGWEHVWTVTVDISIIDGPLECVLKKLKPAHTAILFNYV